MTHLPLVELENGEGGGIHVIPAMPELKSDADLAYEKVFNMYLVMICMSYINTSRMTAFDPKRRYV